MSDPYWMSVSVTVKSKADVERVIKEFSKESTDFDERWVPNLSVVGDYIDCTDGECYSSDIDILQIFFERIARYVEGSVFFEGNSTDEIWRWKIKDNVLKEENANIVYGDIFGHILEEYDLPDGLKESIKQFMTARKV